MRTLPEIDARLAEIKTQIEASAAIENPDDQQRSAEDALYVELEELMTERVPVAQRAASLDALRSIALSGDPTRTENGDGANRAEFNVQPNLPTGQEIYEISRTTFMGMDEGAINTELRGRALKAVEQARGMTDASRHAVAERIDMDDDTPKPDEDTGFRGVAEHVLRTGSDTYRSAFKKFMHNPHGLTLNEAERASMSLTAANGGYLLPFLLDPSIIITNAGATNPFRQISRVIQGNQNVWHGVSSAGVNAEWLGEGSEAADASPTFSQPTITAYKAAAWLQATFEFLEDGNIESEISMLLADAKSRLEATAFAVGSGSGQPKGIVTALQAVTASRVASTTNGAYGYPDVFALDNALGPRWRENASWLANKYFWNATRQFAVGSGALTGTFWVDFGGGIPPKLIGYNVYESSAMQSSVSSATASTDDVIVLGDFRQFVIFDRIGMSLAYEPLVKGASFRPTGHVGWFAHWRVGSDTTSADSFRMLRL